MHGRDDNREAFPRMGSVRPMRYMTVTEVAAALYVDRSTVLRQINRGELEAVRVGHQWRIWPGDVPGLERLRDEVRGRAM